MNANNPVKISIINYGMGNLFSVAKKVNQLGVEYEIISTPQEILNAKKIILPGVGHFGKAIENLKELKLIEPLNEVVLNKKIPVLGICLGMQLMAKSSEEGNIHGLGWFDAEVVKIKVTDPIKYKIPHIGWNSIKNEKNSFLMNGIPDESEFYFVHAYHVKCNDLSDVLNTTIYESNLVSAIQKENIFGVQYHPEKSHEIGKKLIRNFTEI